MTEHDDMVLTLVADSFSGVRMARGTDRIVTRGRTLRRRRRAVPVIAAAGIAAGAALGVSLPPHGSHGAAARDAAAQPAVNVDLAAWSVHTNPDSTVTVTMRQLRDPDLLRQVLAKAGVRAAVVTCPPQGNRLPQIGSVLGSSAVKRVAGAYVLTIHPERMPAGSVLAFEMVHPPASRDEGAVVVELLPHEPAPCTVPTAGDGPR